jgi:hypothetical protein
MKNIKTIEVLYCGTDATWTTEPAVEVEYVEMKKSDCPGLFLEYTPRAYATMDGTIDGGPLPERGRGGAGIDD